MIKCCAADLESLPNIGIECSVVVEDVDERKVMTDSDFVIISIMRRSNLDSSGAEFHVDDDRVRDNWDSAINERVGGEFSMEMLQLARTINAEKSLWVLTVYLGSSGWTAIAVSPSIVSGRVVATMIFSSVKKVNE